jgi:hypothetical protein
MPGGIAAENGGGAGDPVVVERLVQVARLYLGCFPSDHLVQPLDILVDFFDALGRDFHLGQGQDAGRRLVGGFGLGGRRSRCRSIVGGREEARPAGEAEGKQQMTRNRGVHEKVRLAGRTDGSKVDACRRLWFRNQSCRSLLAGDFR